MSAASRRLSLSTSIRVQLPPGWDCINCAVARLKGRAVEKWKAASELTGHLILGLVGVSECLISSAGSCLLLQTIFQQTKSSKKVVPYLHRRSAATRDLSPRPCLAALSHSVSAAAARHLRGVRGWHGLESTDAAITNLIWRTCSHRPTTQLMGVSGRLLPQWLRPVRSSTDRVHGFGAC